VAFSTGCVYPLVDAASGGCREEVSPAPVGEYAWSCLGRERVFEHFSRRDGTPVCLIRLNYAIDLRYGVLHDIATRIARGEPVDLSSSHFNCIWQGDANRQALLALRHCTSPATVLNITGPGTVSTREAALALGAAMRREVAFTGEPGRPTYLSDASRANTLFLPPAVTLGQMVEWTAAWVVAGRPSHGKPTHFEVLDGQF
jgi:nucleoside-diphosphate-sugar epimerase